MKYSAKGKGKASSKGSYAKKASRNTFYGRTNVYRAEHMGGVPLTVGPFNGIAAQPFPQRRIIENQFIDVIGLPATTLAGICSAEENYRLNSLFDPRFSAGGNATTWQTTFANVYRRYLVTHVTVDVTLLNTNNSNFPATFGVTVQNSEEGFTLAGKSIGVIGQHPSIATVDVPGQAGGGTARFRKTIKLWELEGLTYQQWMCNFLAYGATMGANPSRQLLMRMGVFDKQGNNGTALNATVRLTYRAVLFQVEQADYQ